MKLIKSFLTAVFMLYALSVFATIIICGVNGFSEQYRTSGLIYSIVGFIIFMTVIIYKSGEVKNEN